MSDTSKATYSRLPGGEWWYYAGLFRVWAIDNAVEYLAQPTIQGLQFMTPIGRIDITGKDDVTVIRVELASPVFGESVQKLIDWLRLIGEQARASRQFVLGRTYDEAIEGYYRAKARGTKITLRQVADATGLHYGYLREKKAEYDRAGKWGSRSDKTTDKVNDT